MKFLWDEMGHIWKDDRVVSQIIDDVIRPIIYDEYDPKTERFVFYIRLYTYFVQAFDHFNMHDYSEALEFLNVARRFTKSAKLEEEEAKYVKKIDAIIKPIVPKLESLSEQFDASPPSKRKIANIKKSLQAAQNICLLRMLKR
jgi:hypothetical protein